jgi:hypothetical protein
MKISKDVDHNLSIKAKVLNKEPVKVMNKVPHLVKLNDDCIFIKKMTYSMMYLFKPIFNFIIFIIFIFFDFFDFLNYFLGVLYRLMRLSTSTEPEYYFHQLDS